MSVVSPTVTITVHPVPVPSLTLTVDKTEGYIGDTFTFSGTFMQDTMPVVGETVTLIRNGVPVGSAVTNSAGNYVIPWVADVVGTLAFHTEAAVPPLPPIASPVVGVTVGLVPPPIEWLPLAIGSGAPILFALVVIGASELTKTI